LRSKPHDTVNVMANPKGNESSLKKFKPKWQSGETQTIRVPIILAKQILSYAHKLDELPSQVNVEDEKAAIAIAIQNAALTLSQVIDVLEEIADTKRFTQQQKDRLRYEGIQQLETLKQVIKTLSD
jgi:hypothetical protein